MLRAECGNCVHASPPFCRQIMAMLGIARFLDSQSKSLRDPLIPVEKNLKGYQMIGQIRCRAKNNKSNRIREIV